MGTAPLPRLPGPKHAQGEVGLRKRAARVMTCVIFPARAPPMPHRDPRLPPSSVLGQSRRAPIARRRMSSGSRR